MLVNQLLLIVYAERLKKKANRFHMNCLNCIQNRLTIYSSLLSCHKKKQFLYQNVTRWKQIYCPKRKINDSTSTSTPKCNSYGSKILLCIWWDMKENGIWNCKLWTAETESNNHCWAYQQLINLNRALSQKRSITQRNQFKENTKWFCCTIMLDRMLQK